MLSAFGALLFRAQHGTVPRRAIWIGRASIAAAWVFTWGWVALETGSMAGQLSAWPVVLGDTQFGHIVLIRLTLLALAAVAGGGPLAAALAGLGAVSLAGHGHAWAMAGGPSLLLMAETLHLAAAGAWLGGLLPLIALLGEASAPAALLAARRFARLGTVCVALIAATAVYQASVLVGSFAGLVGTAYGQVASVKGLLFLVLLALAARHRFGLTPALAGLGAVRATHALRRSVALEAAIGLLVVLAAGWLTSLEPAMSMD